MMLGPALTDTLLDMTRRRRARAAQRRAERLLWLVVVGMGLLAAMLLVLSPQ
jgi:hypothetical protein